MLVRHLYAACVRDATGDGAFPCEGRLVWREPMLSFQTLRKSGKTEADRQHDNYTVPYLYKWHFRI